MALSITDLTTPLTEDQVMDQFLTILESVGVPARSWRVGGVARSLLRPVARVCSGFTELVSDAVSGQFLPTSTGIWLTFLAAYAYNVSRITATFATGTITLTNTGGGVFVQAARSVVAKNPATGKTYTNSAAFTLGALSTLDAAFIAIEEGSASSSEAGAVTELVTTLTGVTITNAEAIVGSDEQTDESLRSDCLNSLAALSSNGPRGAYIFAAKRALRLDGSAVNINRVSVVSSTSTGAVSIWVASPSGAPIAGDVVAVQKSVDNVARPDTDTATALAAANVALTKSIIIWVKNAANVSAADIRTQAIANLLELTANYPIGGIAKLPVTQGYLYGGAIDGVCKAAHPNVFDVDGAETDIALNPGEVPVLACTVEVRVVEVTSS